MEKDVFDKIVSPIKEWEIEVEKEIGITIRKIRDKTEVINSEYMTSAIKKMHLDYDKVFWKLQGDMFKVLNDYYIDTLKSYTDIIESQGINPRKLYPENNRLIQSKIDYSYSTIYKKLSDTYKGNMIGFTSLDGKTNTLASVFKEITQKAVENMVTNPNGFDYNFKKTLKALGEGGAKVNYSSGYSKRLDSALKQELMYGVKLFHNAQDKVLSDKFDCDVFYVEYHANPRPSHEFLGGQQFSYGKSFYKGSEFYANGRQALERLDDYGCLHIKTSGVSGISTNPYTPKELHEFGKLDNEKIKYGDMEITGYQHKQLVKKVENDLRKLKDVGAIAKASDNQVLINETKQKTKVYRAKLAELKAVV